MKTATDSAASSISLTPVDTTVAQLVSMSPTGSGGRHPGAETTLYRLTNVTMNFSKMETDSDYHLVVSDGSQTMIVEVPFPGCASGSPLLCNMTKSRAAVDSQLRLTSSANHSSFTVSVVGVGFFDALHGQTGVAPNGIELHPVLGICFGQNCDPMQ